MVSFECVGLSAAALYMSLTSAPRQRGFIEMHGAASRECQGETRDVKKKKKRRLIAIRPIVSHLYGY